MTTTEFNYFYRGALNSIYSTYGSYISLLGIDTSTPLDEQSYAGSDEYDVMFTCSWTSNEYAPYAKKGAFVRLDDPEDNLLDEYGKDVEAALPALLPQAKEPRLPEPGSRPAPGRSVGPVPLVFPCPLPVGGGSPA